MFAKLAFTGGRPEMPTRNVNLTPELEDFVASSVESGRFENASEVVRAALRSLERDEQLHQAKIEALRAAIDEGDSSGLAKGDVFAQVRKSLKLPAKSRR
jgi:antitoxin ParD1/3/4